MELHQKDALISAIGAARKSIAFLVGSPFSTDMNGNGVPGISKILDIVHEVVIENAPSGITRYEEAIVGKSGASAYQSAMGWLQANVHQDAVNTVIQRAVLKSCIDISTVGNSENPTCDGEPSKWYIPEGTRSLAALVTSYNSRFSGPILTPNFDPLLSLAIRDAGGNSSRRVLDADGTLPREVDDEPDTSYVIHFHGYWRNSDTLHTPTQLRSSRPKLKASLQRLLRKHVLVVVAYGGWDDVFTSALADLLHDDQAELEVLWCFHETVPAIVKDQYKQLLDSVETAITRGRFRCYGGVDCHSIFSDVALAMNNLQTPSLTNTTRVTETTVVDNTINNSTGFRNSAEVLRYLSNKLDEALISFSSQPIIWVDPVVCKNTEVAKDSESEPPINLVDFMSTPKSTIIKAPPQFGLTCLARYLAKEAWQNYGSLWLYFDTRGLKPHTASIEQACEIELKHLGCERQEIKGVILDSWIANDKNMQKILHKLCSYFVNTPIIVMESLQSSQFENQLDEKLFDREFDALYLWALPRGHIRKVVAEYNEVKHIGDEDVVTSKVISDLEVLNIHRTPLNCITLLKVSELDFDESPVNRTEMIKRVLFLLFNVDDIPTYKVRPDLKDCEYVLGYFCETMLRENNYYFTREQFLNKLTTCCKERLFDLEVQVVFDVLFMNNIIIQYGNLFCFRFSYWIYYFAAQRMYHNKYFADFIYKDMRYANYPEIIEFYTGTDRQREDALLILIDDVRAARDKVEKKCGLPDGFNPYRFAQWRPSAKMLVQMQNEFCDGVMHSNLPEVVKDRYADRQYDRSRPYNQEIQEIISEYSLLCLMQTLKAGARALRNSDYVKPEIKRELLREIMLCWEQITKVLMILVPLLAEKGQAAFDGIGFIVDDCFGDKFEERLQGILSVIPNNVVSWCKDDLFSQKMGPLLIDQFKKDDSEMRRHNLILLLIQQRPRDWNLIVHKYIADSEKNSFYLYDVYHSLRAQYRFSYASPQSLKDIKRLIKMAIAKHETGNKNPGIELINKVSEGVIPDRVVEGDKV
jgi:hypothetical protein